MLRRTFVHASYLKIDSGIGLAYAASPHSSEIHVGQNKALKAGDMV